MQSINQTPVLPSIENLENIADLIEYNTEKFSCKTIQEQDGQKTILLAFAAGQGLPQHTAARNTVLVMLEGICEFTLNDFGHLLKAGEIIQVAAGEPHHFKAFTDFKMLVIKSLPGRC